MAYGVPRGMPVDPYTAARQRNLMMLRGQRPAYGQERWGGARGNGRPPGAIPPPPPTSLKEWREMKKRDIRFMSS